MDLTKTEQLHPCWFVARVDKHSAQGEKANAEIAFETVPVLVAADYKELTRLAADVVPSCHTFQETMPFIVNSRDIKGAEVIAMPAHLRNPNR